MKQLWTPVVVMFLLAACTSEKGADVPPQPAAAAPVDMHNSQNSLDWAGEYQGVLACQDCPGTKTRLTLGNDGSYVLQSLQMKLDAQTVALRGQFTWQPDGNSILLDSAGAGQQFAVGEGRLTLLNSDGSRPGPDATNRTLVLVSAEQAAADTVTVSFLQDHRWRLEAATAGANERIEALFPAGKPFEFSFSGSNLAVTGGCNGLRGSYQIDNQGQLLIGRMVSTMMACEPALMNADAALSAMLANPLQIMLVQGAQPTLILISAVNEVLMLTGQKTLEALYGPGTRMFLEVAAQTAACQNPQTGETQCLQVREITFDEQGLRVGSPGEWQPFYGRIEGYEHTPGQSNIVRVNRFQPASMGAGSATPAIYVLDLVVESGSEAP